MRRFDVLAKYFSDGPTGYLDPTALSAQLKLITREVNNATLEELKERSDNRITEIYEQQQEVDELPQIIEMLRKYSSLRVNLSEDVLPTFIDYNYVAWNGSETEYLRCELATRAPKYIGQCTELIECTRANQSTPFTCPQNADLSSEECNER